jgi:hypothetical protein
VIPPEAFFDLREIAIRANRAASGCPLLAVELPAMSGGLNWSVQHYLEVYLPEFESPKFVAGVD